MWHLLQSVGDHSDELELSRKVHDPWTVMQPFNIESHCTTASEALLGSTNQRRRIVFLNRAGYLGYNLSRGLAEQGDHVTMVGDADDSYLAAIVRRHRNDSERIPGGKFSHITGKMCDQGFLKHVFSLYIPTYVLLSHVDKCTAPGPNKDVIRRLSCATNILEAARNFQGIRVVTLGVESTGQDEDVISSGPVKEPNAGNVHGAELSAVAHAVRQGQEMAFSIYRNVFDLTVTTVALKVLNGDKYGLCLPEFQQRRVESCGTAKMDDKISDSSKDLSIEADVKRDVVAQIVPKLAAILRIRHLCFNYRILVDFSGRHQRQDRGKLELTQGDSNGYVRKNKIAVLSKNGIKSLNAAPNGVVPHMNVAKSARISQTSHGCSNKSVDGALRGSVHAGERNTNKLELDNVRDEVQQTRTLNGKNVKDSKVNLVLSCQFVNFRNSRKKSSRFEITKMWYWGLKDHGLKATVLHGGLRASYIKRVSDRNLTFHRVNMNEFTKSAKFFAFLEYLSAHPDVGKVILTDNSDVRFQRNPFALMDLLGDHLYVGTDVDIYPNIASMAWLTRRLEECFGHSFAQSKEFPSLTQMPYVYNAGVIGGPRHLVMQLLEKLTFVLDGVNPKAKNICNMAALNMVLHKYFADKVFTGFPWNSRYLRRQKNPKGVYVIHK
ncbi:uncharacterized protein [Branchiostoma lanceolatum]|uniref:uncharacterized protein isoform X2 n=1 Tax=Branchiostoma lanceolatum TaxID=7740 RepID=UPI0034572C17